MSEDQVRRQDKVAGVVVRTHSPSFRTRNNRSLPTRACPEVAQPLSESERAGLVADATAVATAVSVAKRLAADAGGCTRARVRV